MKLSIKARHHDQDTQLMTQEYKDISIVVEPAVINEQSLSFIGIFEGKNGKDGQVITAIILSNKDAIQLADAIYKLHGLGIRTMGDTDIDNKITITKDNTNKQIADLKQIIQTLLKMV